MKTDAEIQQSVMEELSWQPLLKACEIGVAVKNGIVTLSGSVNTFTKKAHAEKAAAHVAGVKAVAEDIQVRIGDESRKTDTEIAAAVVNALKWHNAMQHNKISIKVENAWVTLEGEVDWEFERNSARLMVEDLKGVIGITNNIFIKPSPQPKDLATKISAAFQRSASLDSKHVNVEVKGTKVTLTGKVRSYAEKRDAEKAVWFAPGVNEVDNRLEIDMEVFAN